MGDRLPPVFAIFFAIIFALFGVILLIGAAALNQTDLRLFGGILLGSALAWGLLGIIRRKR